MLLTTHQETGKVLCRPQTQKSPCSSPLTSPNSFHALLSRVRPPPLSNLLA